MKLHWTVLHCNKATFLNLKKKVGLQISNHTKEIHSKNISSNTIILHQLWRYR